MSGQVLAQLMAQASEGRADLVTLRAIAEEAGEQAATRALARAGLSDEAARADMAELRELLGAWRYARASAWRLVWGWLLKVVGALVLASIAVRLGWEARP